MPSVDRRVPGRIGGGRLLERDGTLTEGGETLKRDSRLGLPNGPGPAATARAGSAKA